MSASLLMIGPAASYELIDQSVNGGTYLSGYSGNTEDLGQPEVDTATIIGQLVDGDRVAGPRSGNRTPNLPILVTGTSSIDLTTKVNALIQIVDDQQGDGFTLQWTPDGGVPVFIDALRGTWSRQREPVVEAQFQTIITLNFPALPFTRSTTTTTIVVPASGAAAQVQVDGMNSGTFNLGSGGTLDTTNKYEGAGSMSVVMQFTKGISTGGYQTLSYASAPAGRTVSSTNLSTESSLSIRARMVTAYPGFTVTATLTLTSPGGSSTVTTTFPLAAGSTAWALLSFPISHLVGTVNLAAVTGWTVTYQTTVIIAAVGATNGTANTDDLRAYPPGSIGNSTAEGAVVTIPSVGGTARTPCALEIDRAGSTFVNALVHSPPVSQDPDVTILAGLSSGTITIPAANMNYAIDGQASSTYALLGFITASGSGTRTVTATITQKQGAATVSTQTLTVSISSTTATIVNLGRVALPLVAIPPENTGGSIVILVSSTGDTWSDIALCSTKGQSILVTGLPSTTEALYVDTPSPVQSIGQIYAAASIARTAATSVLGLSIPDGGPMQFEPGNNKLLVASTSGALGVTASFYRRWLDEADSL